MEIEYCNQCQAVKKYYFQLVFVFLAFFANANSILIPMDETQRNHLKAYGLAYFALQQNIPLDWLLNYRGGSFLIAYSPAVQSECTIRGIFFELISPAKTNSILQEIASPAVNMNVVRLMVE